jgi:FkbM family methyltransferase
MSEITKNVDGVSITIPAGDWMLRDIEDGRHYEPYVETVLLNAVPLGGTYVDVGANVGYFCAIVGARRNARVIAVEPYWQNIQYIRRNMVDNGLTNHAIYPAAASSAVGVEAIDGSKGSNHVVIPASSTTLPVISVTLDLLLSREQVDLIKVDVEGREWHVLTGAKETIEREKPGIVMEYSPDFIRRGSGVEGRLCLDFLRSFGYSLTILDRSCIPEPNCSNERIHAAWTEYTARNITHLDLFAS